MSLIAALAGEQPAQAAERLRSLATRLQADVERAADLLDRAHGLSLCEADLEKKAELFASSPARALGPLGQLARARPAATDRRSRLEAAVRATGDTERADLLASAGESVGADDGVVRDVVGDKVVSERRGQPGFPGSPEVAGAAFLARSMNWIAASTESASSLAAW